MKRVLGISVVFATLAMAAWVAVPRLTRTLGSTQSALRFFVIGDNHGPREVYKELLGKAKASGATFAVNVADLTEHGTAEELQAVLTLEAAVGLPVYHVVGSHDIKSDPSRDTWRQHVGPAYQAFTVGTARFLLLDNADRQVGFPAEELRWIDRTLAADANRTTFLFYHRPFGLPLEGLFGDDETAASRTSNDAFRAILRQHRPTMIFSGHVHTYLPYTVEGVPAYVTGGGGDSAQTLLGGTSASFFHGLFVTVRARGHPEVTVLRSEGTP